MRLRTQVTSLVIASTLSIGAAAQGTAPANTTGPSGNGVNNAFLYSVAWKQTAAEYWALYFQGFNVAWMHVELALDKR